MKLESTFHSGKTLYKVSQRRHLQSMTGPTCLRNQRASLTRCDDSKRMYLPGIMTSPIYKIHEWAIGRRCKINILEWQSLHWGRDSSTTPSSWYFQTFKFPHSLHIRGQEDRILTTCEQLRGFEWMQFVSLPVSLRSSGQEGMHSFDP